MGSVLGPFAINSNSFWVLWKREQKGSCLHVGSQRFDTERAAEALKRIKEKNPMNGMKGRGDQRCWIEILAQCVST